MRIADANKPSHNVAKRPLGTHGRQVLANTAKFMKHYRPAMKVLAMRRASQLMRADRPLTAKQQRKAKQAKK